MKNSCYGVGASVKFYRDTSASAQAAIIFRVHENDQVDLIAYNPVTKIWTQYYNVQYRGTSSLWLLPNEPDP